MVPVNMLFSNLKDVMFGMILNSAGIVPVNCRQASAVSRSVQDEHHSKLSYGHRAMLSDPDKQTAGTGSKLLIRHSTT